MKNSKGFSLLEVIVSLSIITTMMATAFPLLLTVYNERITIRETFDALDILQGTIQEYLFDGQGLQTEEVYYNSTEYFIEVDREKSDEIEYYSVCVNWIGRNNRNYERCEYAKK